MENPRSDRLVRWATALLVVATFILITTGGAVTSRNAGLSVPDWPTSFGRWLVIPLRLWADAGVFLEHNHRLTGAVAGLIAIAMLVTVGRRFGWKRPITALAWVVLVLYVVQGVLGGVRVTEKSIALAIIHGVHGQVLLGLTVALAVLVRRPVAPPKAGAVTGWVLLSVLLLQLILGAAIRHTNTASAIPDAPLVYGSLVPPGSQEQILSEFYDYGGDEFLVYVEEPAATIEETETPHTLTRTPMRPAMPPSIGAVQTQYLHRLIGMLILPALIVVWGYRVSRQHEALAAARAPLAWLALLWAAQVLLGLSVIWSRERWEITTGHQAVGALFLAVATWLLIRLHCQNATEQPTAT